MLRRIFTLTPAMGTMAVLAAFIPAVAWPVATGDTTPWIVAVKVACALVCAWVAMLPAAWMPRLWKHLWEGAWLLFTGVWMVVDAFCISRFNAFFSPGFIPIVMGTNGGEVMEFFRESFSGEFFVWSGSALALAAAAWWALRRWTVPMRMAVPVLLTAVVVTVVTLVADAQAVLRYGGSLPTKFVALSRIERRQRVYPVPPKGVTRGQDAPTDIVLIIGESLKPSHMSLYGYERPTTPRLDSLRRLGRLVRADSAVTPGFHTIQAFRRFMSLYDGSDTMEWYRQTTVIDLARALGYRTVWLSNQNKAGLYDNVITEYALTADTACWTKTRPLGSITVPGYDERLLPLLDSFLEADSVPTLWVIHLMGNHNFFAQRYPPSRSRFRAADYHTTYAPAAAQLAAYDNAVTYNDSVVAEIIGRFDPRDAVAVYFSDHGLDLYESNPTIFTHAIEGNAVSERAARPVPFMLAASPRATHRLADFDPSVTVNTDTLIRIVARLMKANL